MRLTIKKKNPVETPISESNDWKVELLEGKFAEGEKVRVRINGKEVVRSVRYNRADGLYIVYNSCKYFDTDII